MSIFKRGYIVARDEAKKAEERRASFGKMIYEFYLTDDKDEAEVVFLNEEPVNCFTHNRISRRNGKEFFDTVVCTQDENCPDCNDGERATYKGAYLIVDLRPYEYKDDKGKKQTKEQTLRFYMPGNRIVTQLDRISTKYGLADSIMNIVRHGKGTKTNYIVENTNEEYSFSKKELETLMTDEVKKLYNGSEESIYDIIEQQLEIRLSSTGEDADEEKEDTDDGRSNIVRKGSRKTKDEDDEGEDRSEPPRTVLRKRKSLFKSRQAIDDSDDLPY